MEDSMVLELHKFEQYSAQYLYAVLNFRGIIPIYSPAVWILHEPPRVQLFLWLLSNNKLLTRDNLMKGQTILNESFLLCEEK
jgi:hypothetical protein